MNPTDQKYYITWMAIPNPGHLSMVYAQASDEPITDELVSSAIEFFEEAVRRDKNYQNGVDFGIYNNGEVKDYTILPTQLSELNKAEANIQHRMRAYEDTHILIRHN